MTSENTPWSTHGLEERKCEFCGELFYANHGLQRYCPEKFNRKGYCKKEQKKLVDEKNLADFIAKIARIKTKLDTLSTLEINRLSIKKIMGNHKMKIVDDLQLDNAGVDILHFEKRTPIEGTQRFLIHIGEFTLECIEKNELQLKFKIITK